MKIPNLFQSVRAFADENSPVILTGIALVGLGATTYLTHKGTKQAELALVEEVETRNALGQLRRDIQITNQEKFLLTYKFYAPAAVTFVSTSVCMVMATKIGLNRTAALGAALVVAERNGDAYRDKVKEILGENKHTKVVDAVATDRVAEIPEGQILVAREGEQVFIDSWSGRQLSTTMVAMERAVNKFNQEMLGGEYSSLTEFYRELDMDPIQESNDIGWNSKDGLMGLNYTTVLKNDRAVVVFEFDSAPRNGFRHPKSSAISSPI